VGIYLYQLKETKMSIKKLVPTVEEKKAAVQQRRNQKYQKLNKEVENYKQDRDKSGFANKP
jgi:hypothetical protein